MLSLRDSRLGLRLRYALERSRKFVGVLNVRYLRKNLVRCYYRHRDVAPPPSIDHAAHDQSLQPAVHAMRPVGRERCFSSAAGRASPGTNDFPVDHPP